MSEARTPADESAETIAEKAYAAAAEAIVPAVPAPAKSVKAPAVLPAAEADAPAPIVAVPAAVAKPQPPKAPVATPVAVKPPRAAIAAPKAKPVKAKPIATPPAPARPTAPVVAPKLAARKITSSARPTAVPPAAIPTFSTAPQLKDKTMESTSKFTDGFKTVTADAQEKAKEIYTKGSAILGEAGEFTKGNVQAVVASGKILATGLKSMGDSLVAESKEAIETMSADVKQVASVKSPTELVKLQGELMQRNLDKMVAYNSKTTEALLKLTTEMMAPMTARFSLATEKVRSFA